MKNLLVAIAAVVLSSSPAAAQPPASQRSESAIVGTVVSSGPSSIIVRTDDGSYVVFSLDQDTLRPPTIATGARVRVESAPDEDNAARRATRITLTGTQPSGNQPPPADDAIPPEARRLEQQIARGARRYHFGLRAGVGLDPEVISLGAHTTLGPIFTRGVFFRPNLEFAYGELTTLFAINLEGIYRIARTESRRQWSPYVGGGPTLGFSHQGFTTPAGTERSFDFGNFDFNGGLNLLGGVEKPNGPFIELKATIYADPHVRLLFGITF